ncbi:MAG TPA: PH domain-containing protein [Proteobacteria bacterium]|nr:PH domain-containing protein [Pseudomonadota bacterium]
MSEFDETIIYQARPSWLYYHCLYVVGMVLFGFSIKSGELGRGIFVLLLIVGLAAIFRFRYQFAVTDDRIITRVGLVARNTNEMKLRHIRSMNVRQNPIERLLGIGTLITMSAANGEAAVVFKGIKNPHGVKERIRGVQG